MNLEGTWYNELGSSMTISAVTDGGFTFTYETAVSSKNCAKGTFLGVGRTDTGSGGHTVGCVVSWKNELSDCRAVTAWSGQVATVNGEDEMIMFWLLTEYDPKNNWASTNIGQDVFKRQESSEAENDRLTRRRSSHA